MAKYEAVKICSDDEFDKAVGLIAGAFELIDPGKAYAAVTKILLPHHGTLDFDLLKAAADLISYSIPPVRTDAPEFYVAMYKAYVSETKEGLGELRRLRACAAKRDIEGAVKHALTVGALRTGSTVAFRMLWEKDRQKEKNAANASASRSKQRKPIQAAVRKAVREEMRTNGGRKHKAMTLVAAQSKKNVEKFGDVLSFGTIVRYCKVIRKKNR